MRLRHDTSTGSVEIGVVCCRNRAWSLWERKKEEKVGGNAADDVVVGIPYRVDFSFIFGR